MSPDDIVITPEPQVPSETTIDLERLPSEEVDLASGPSRYELFTYPADFTLEVLYQKWKNDEIVIPPLQRGFVWSQLQASRLIESFLLGLPVPGIFLYVERKTEKYLVVDGQQRLRSVFYFFDGTFGEEKLNKKIVFRLTLPEPSPWHGKTFGDLREEDRLKLKNSVLRAFVMKQISPEDDTSIYHVFERLNTGGTLLAAQEVRNSIYNGPFNNLLHELNALPAWRDILGKPADPRLKDVELVLRFLALYKAGDAYQKPMKTFLNDFMRRYKDGQLNNELRPVFLRVASDVGQRLGLKPFHLHAGVNVPVLDAVFVAFARQAGAISPDIVNRYRALLADEQFQRWTSRATTDGEAVKGRIELARQRLFA